MVISLFYAKPTHHRFSKLAIIAMILGLLSGPLMFLTFLVFDTFIIPDEAGANAFFAAFIPPVAALLLNSAAAVRIRRNLLLRGAPMPIVGAIASIVWPIALYIWFMLAMSHAY